jgi:putative acetyltransferase
MEIRQECPEDVDAIRDLITFAFKGAPHSSQTEAAIVAALRREGALTLSLVAIEDGALVGHVAFSPVTINGETNGWYGLGPVAVRSERQRRGIGRALIQEGLDHLREMNAEGCVVLGNPAYYSRFGFMSNAQLRFGSVPLEYFQRLAFTESEPKGEVSYHAGFNAS